MLSSSLFLKKFIYLWLCWVFVSVQGLSLVAASGGRSSSRCAGLSLSRPLLLRSTGSRHADSIIVAHGPSCSAACGIFPDQGSNPCHLHWQADSQPLRHQGSPTAPFFFDGKNLYLKFKLKRDPYVLSILCGPIDTTLATVAQNLVTPVLNIHLQMHSLVIIPQDYSTNNFISSNKLLIY